MIQCADLTFSHSRRRPLYEELDLTFPTGRTVLLGPNGAGKTTLLRIIAGELRARSGAILLDGVPVAARQLRRRVSFMPQAIAPIRGLSTLEYTRYAAWLRGVSRSDTKAAALRALAQVALVDEQDRPSSKLSGGQLRRLGLAAALVSDPQVLLLDEPTASLDPEQRHRFRSVMQSVPDSLTTVVSTHQIDDVEDIYHQVAVLHTGSLAWSGTPEDFLGLAAGASRQQAEEAYLRIVGGS